MNIPYSGENRLVGLCGGKSAVCSLSLIFDYPVRWSKYKVLRDLIQNFYDAIGHSRWQQRFRWRIENGCLYLLAQKVGFSYEWLLHIGASTKRESPGQYAGYFGEGFKIAALCALRDFGWQLELASRDWELKVITGITEVEKQPLTTLGYRIWSPLPPCSDTALCIYPFQELDKPLLESVLLSFYYEQNPLLGETLWSGQEGAVHLRTKVRKPSDYPSTYDARGEGIVFASYQALGSFEFPLVVALHRCRPADRDRSSFYRMDVVSVLKSVSRLLTPEAAYRVLEIFKPEWYRYPTKDYDFDSNYPIVCGLIERLSRDQKQVDRFRVSYPHLLVAERVARKDVRRYNRRRQARSWMSERPERFRLVQDGFLRLGYPSLEALCETHDGFNVVREPTPAEREPLSLLEETALQLFGRLFDLPEFPPCRILKNGVGVWMGMAECVPVREANRSGSGWGRRFGLPYIALKQYLLSPGLGGEALSTYLHELAHMFGPDGSARFSHALTEALRISIARAEEIREFQCRWDKACREGKGD